MDAEVPRMPTARQARKRSPKACLSCRARKVRCDVAFTPKACTNCILDKKECVVTRRRHQHRKPSPDEAGLPPGLDADDHSVTETMDDPDTPASSEARPGVRPTIHFACYHFLRMANLSDMPPDDAGFLESQACLEVPNRYFIEGLLRAYFQYVHPVLPIVDEAGFWAAYDDTGRVAASPIPVLLLQAMLFAAFSYAPNEYILGMGFSNTQEAKDRQFRKAKLLYDMETESSPAVLAQVCLLLSHWSPSGHHGKQSTWLHRAVQHARDAGAHLEPVSRPQPRHRARHGLLRRVWWCCRLCDCLHSLYARKPLVIITPQTDSPDMHETLSRADLSHEIGRSRVYDAETKQHLIEAQEQMGELCNVLCKVLAAVYQDEQPAPAVATQTVHSCKAALRIWHIHASSSFLDPIWQVSQHCDKSGGSKEVHPVGLCINLMYLHYQSAMLALCHLEMKRVTASTSQQQQQRIEIAAAVAELADRLGSCARRGYLDKLPNTIAPCTLLPLFLHLYDSDVAESDLERTSSQLSCAKHLNRLPRIIKSMRLRYPEDVKAITAAAMDAVKCAQRPVWQSGKTAQGDSRAGWCDLVSRNPEVYASLITSLDSKMAWGNLSRGVAPPVAVEPAGHVDLLQQLLAEQEAEGTQSFSPASPVLTWPAKLRQQEPSPPSSFNQVRFDDRDGEYYDSTPSSADMHVEMQAEETEKINLAGFGLEVPVKGLGLESELDYLPDDNGQPGREDDWIGAMLAGDMSLDCVTMETLESNRLEEK